MASDSVLNTTKQALGILPADTAFDAELIIHINSVFSTLQQLGVGPKAAFAINSDTETWKSFLDGTENLNAVKSYMAIKVRLIFDPPSTSFGIESLQKMASEWEWRLNTHAETP